MINLNKVKDKILNMAFEGKISKPVANDSNAIDIINKLNVKEDEFDGELPIGWKCLALFKVAKIYTGDSTNASEKEEYSILKKDYLPYVSTKDINMDSTVNYKTGVYLPKNYKFKIAEPMSILFCIEGANAGKKIALTSEKTFFGNKLCCLFTNVISVKYLFYFLQSSLFRKTFAENKTGIIGGVSISKIKNILLPFPCIEEQERIVEILDNVFAYIKNITDCKNNLNSNLYLLYDEIIKMAVFGKMPNVQQSTSKESFMKQIIFELKKENKQKELNTLTVLNNKQKQQRDELIKNIPSHWAILKGSACFKKMESMHPDGDEFYYIDIDAIDNERYTANPKLKKTKDAPSRATRKLHEGDTIVSMVRPYLKNICFIDSTLENCIASTGFYVFSPYSFIDNEYLFLFLRSSYCIKEFTKLMKGNNSPSFNNSDIEDFLFPIPPLEEQIKIVKTTNEILSHINKVKENVNIMQ